MIERSATPMTPTRGVPVISRHRTVDSGSRPGTAFPGNLYLGADELPDIGDPQADPLTVLAIETPLGQSPLRNQR